MKNKIKAHLTILLFALLSITLSGCEKFFFYPDKALLYNPSICARQPENYLIDTEDGYRLHAWLFRTTVPNPKGTIIFFHGNAQNMSAHSLGMLWVLDQGYDLFTFDYRGYGVSNGAPSIQGILQDSIDVVEAFMDIKNTNKMNLILYGQSLGGAASVYVAANSKYADNFSSLVLDSTFSSWSDIARSTASKVFITWPFQSVIASSFSDKPGAINLIKLSKIKKTLIMHSEADALIDISQGEKLFEAANEPKKMIVSKNATHANLTVQRDVQKQVLDFINNI